MAELETTYEKWMQAEGIPIVRGHGVEGIWAVQLGEWKRLGGRGAFVHLAGMEGLTGMYVVEIPAGGSLQPEAHLYDETMYVLEGSGATEISQGGEGERGVSHFEWQPGSLFAMPLNTRHTLYNGSGVERALLVAVISAPIALDLFHDPEFVFNCNYQFTDHYDGAADYFKPNDERKQERITYWETNFIPDVRVATIDLQGPPQLDKHSTGYEMGGNTLVGHIEAWPAGLHDKAHHHGGGAVILIIAGQGYTLMWPKEVGVRPYEAGRGQEVMRFNWQAGTVLCPPTGWFHQHFNSGSEPMRFIAFRFGSQRYGVRFHDSQSRAGVLVSVRKGGTQIDYADEDPQITAQYTRELASAYITPREMKFIP